MADPETLAALKRAYADTILNTTKEAAARVMVSEKKARRYQQELVTVKDEALHMLLRLKQMFDSKVKESEMISLKQQQKVEELEAQLGEAEDIVGELRLELGVLRDELNKVTNGQTYLTSDHEEDSCQNNSVAAVSVLPEVSCSQERSGAVGSCIPVVANGIRATCLTHLNSIKRCSYDDNKIRCHHSLPSILAKRKEAEGCTHMIHWSVANGDLSSSVEVGDVNDGVCLLACKSVETLEISGHADASDSIRDGEDPMVSPREHETEARKEAKESCEDIEVSGSPLSDETPVLEVDKKRCIKYTFKRKRKKEVLSNLEGDSSSDESRNMKHKTAEKEDGYVESLKRGFTGESSWDSLHVADVARQDTACTILGGERFCSRLTSLDSQVTSKP